MCRRMLRRERNQAGNARNNAGAAASHQCRAIRACYRPCCHSYLPLTGENASIRSYAFLEEAINVISGVQDAKRLGVHFQGGDR